MSELSAAFKRFAALETHGMTPMYGRISHRIAEDPELLAIAAHTLPGQPAPNILFAAVHFLLLAGGSHPLRDYYQTVAPENARSPADPQMYPKFRDFCLQHRHRLLDLVRARRTQTNEVNRCCLLLPVFAQIAAQEAGRKLAMIEVGSSAGLNLNWQRYRYDYGQGRLFGDPDAGLTLSSEARGAGMPPIPPDFPGSALVDENLGIEMHPVDLDDPADRLWLQALVWPDHLDRFARLQRAFRIASQNPPRIIPGDALVQLPDVISQLPAQQIPVVFHTFALYQFSRQDQARFLDQLSEIGKTRRIHRLAVEWIGGDAPTISWDTWNGDGRIRRVLADCNPHGRWIAWR